MSDESIAVGRIVGAFGVQGWVRVKSYTEPVENIFEYRPWRIATRDGLKLFDVLDGRSHSDGQVVVQLQGIADRDLASALRGSEVIVTRSQLPEAGAEEIYWVDLIGCEVQTVDGIAFGTIAELIETGSNDVLVVRGGRERLIPFLRGQVVKSVDLVARKVIVEWDPEF